MSTDTATTKCADGTKCTLARCAMGFPCLRTGEVSFEQPTMDCPRCRRVYEDFDGVGVVYCAPPEGCGYCRHLARTGGVCDYCGDTRSDR